MELNQIQSSPVQASSAQLMTLEPLKRAWFSPVLPASTLATGPSFTQVQAAVTPNQGQWLASDIQPSGTDAFYLDTQSLNSLKHDADSDSALREVSRQFEALFVQEMLKRMRQATEALGSEDNPLSNNANNMFQSMFDSQMAVSMTKKSSFGLADLLYQQLSGNSVGSDHL